MHLGINLQDVVLRSGFEAIPAAVLLLQTGSHRLHKSIALLSKGLMEDAAQPDVIVEFTASGVDYNVGPGGIANPINASRGDRGGSRGALGPDGTGERGPVDFSIGTLVVDVKTAQPSSLIWRGVYHANEKNSAKLGQKFPDDAKKLLAEYPGRKK